jgi:hypothetical protein
MLEPGDCQRLPRIAAGIVLFVPALPGAAGLRIRASRWRDDATLHFAAEPELPDGAAPAVGTAPLGGSAAAGLRSGLITRLVQSAISV